LVEDHIAWAFKNSAAVDTLSFDVSGKFVVAGTRVGVVRVLRATDGSEVKRLVVKGDVVAAQIAPDGTSLHIVSTTATETVFGVQTLQPQELVHQICTSMERNLSPSEWRQYLSDEPYHKTCPGLPAGY
jgi:hypothetical protein